MVRQLSVDTTLGIPKDSIVLLPGSATSTQMEALVVREYIKQNPETDTLIIVSSPSHTRRAGMIFERILQKENSNVCILTSPSAYNSFTGEGWWKSREDVQKVLSEYVKLVVWVVWERWRV